MMDKIQSRTGCSGKSFAVMKFHAQRLDEY